MIHYSKLAVETCKLYQTLVNVNTGRTLRNPSHSRPVRGTFRPDSGTFRPDSGNFCPVTSTISDVNALNKAITNSIQSVTIFDSRVDSAVHSCTRHLARKNHLLSMKTQFYHPSNPPIDNMLSTDVFEADQLAPDKLAADTVAELIPRGMIPGSVVDDAFLYSEYIRQPSQDLGFGCKYVRVRQPDNICMPIDLVGRPIFIGFQLLNPGLSMPPKVYILYQYFIKAFIGSSDAHLILKDLMADEKNIKH